MRPIALDVSRLTDPSLRNAPLPIIPTQPSDVIVPRRTTCVDHGNIHSDRLASADGRRRSLSFPLRRADPKRTQEASCAPQYPHPTETTRTATASRRPARSSLPAPLVHSDPPFSPLGDRRIPSRPLGFHGPHSKIRPGFLVLAKSGGAAILHGLAVFWFEWKA